ncbi:MAG: efflux RND transporter periplasmic adaptor subunit, partial [Methylocystis sp.]|uniref:efflux RND transporter periplasmic adaptor subunit n=1 Tax=Methylocystis sp. TaxID=1911079 RepID=UPI003DA30662
STLTGRARGLRGFVLSGALLAAAVSASACSKQVEKEAHAGPAAPSPKVAVTVAEATAMPIVEVTEHTGHTESPSTVEIRARTSGYLVRAAFREGELVKKGQPLFVVDQKPYQVELTRARAELASVRVDRRLAAKNAARSEALFKSSVISEQEWDGQSSNVELLAAKEDVASAAVSSAALELEYTTIRSPIDGRVGIRLVDVGNILHPSDQSGIVVVTQLRPIYVVFTLPQQALPAVQKAQAAGVAKVRALGPDNASVLEIGDLSVVDNQIDQLTGTVKLKATFANRDLGLWPGQFVNVRLMLDTIRNATVVPSPAVQRGPNGAFVYVLDGDGRAHMRNVTTGRQDEHTAVIASGLDPGTTVVTSGFARLFDGAKVHVSHTDEPPAPVGAAASAPAPAEAAAPGERAKGRAGRREHDAKGEGSPGR